jgi:hypothetical protein
MSAIENLTLAKGLIFSLNLKKISELNNRHNPLQIGKSTKNLSILNYLIAIKIYQQEE